MVDDPGASPSDVIYRYSIAASVADLAGPEKVQRALEVRLRWQIYARGFSKLSYFRKGKCAIMDVPRLLLFRTSRPIQEAPKFTCATVSVPEWWVFVSDGVVLQYVGFESKGAIREYTFTLRGSGGASSEYIVTIANDAFVAHRVRYQDGPDICSLRLHREFATRTDHPPSTRFPISDAELAEYQRAHTPKPKPSAFVPAEEKES
jgi:hypothetical protein